MLQKTRTKIYNLLRWSEQYTKTDMVYLTRGGFWLILGQIISTACSFLLAIVFANLLPKEIYGVYKYALSVAGAISALSLTGINTAVTQAVARGFEGTLKKSISIQLSWSIIMFLASITGAGYYFAQGNNILAVMLLFIAVTLPLSTSTNTYTALLVGKKEFKSAAKYSTISSVFISAASFIILLFTKNPLWLVLVYLLSTTGTNIFFYFYSIRKFRPNKKNDPTSLSYGKHLSLIVFLGTAISYLDNILVFHYLGSVALAIYSFASAPADQMKGLSKTLSTLFIPKIAPQSLAKANETINKRIPQLIFVGLLTALIYIILIPPFFQIFFPKYLDSIWFARLFGLNVMLMPVNTVIGSAINAKLVEMPKKWLYRFHISIQTITIGSLLLLAPTWGITGVILSKTLSTFVSILISLYYWKKTLRIKIAPQEEKTELVSAS